MEDKLLSLKCEYNMLLCKEDHNGGMGEFAQSMTRETSRFRDEDESDKEYRQEFVLVPSNKNAGAP